MDSITILDKPYSKKKQAEGRAIAWAVASGACNLCRYLGACQNNPDFIPPGNTACMKKKTEILRSMED